MPDHQLNVRVSDELFRDLRSAYAREIDRRARLARTEYLSWSAFVRECITYGAEYPREGVPRGDAPDLFETPPALSRAQRRRLVRAKRRTSAVPSSP